MNDGSLHNKVVEIKKHKKYGYGFSVIGGEGSEFPPLILDIIKNSPADLSGNICPGDVILQINSHNVSSYSTKEVLNYLKQCTNEVTLTLNCDNSFKSKIHELKCNLKNPEFFFKAISEKDLAGIREIHAYSNGLSTARDDDNFYCTSPRSDCKELNVSKKDCRNSEGRVYCGDLKSFQFDPTNTKTNKHNIENNFKSVAKLVLDADICAKESIYPKMMFNGFQEYSSHSVPGSPDNQDILTDNYHSSSPKSEPSHISEAHCSFDSNLRALPSDLMRLSKSEDFLQRPKGLSQISIELEEDIASSINTLLDTTSDALCIKSVKLTKAEHLKYCNFKSLDNYSASDQFSHESDSPLINSNTPSIVSLNSSMQFSCDDVCVYNKMCSIADSLISSNNSSNSINSCARSKHSSSKFPSKSESTSNCKVSDDEDRYFFRNNPTVNSSLDSPDTDVPDEIEWDDITPTFSLTESTDRFSLNKTVPKQRNSSSKMHIKSQTDCNSYDFSASNGKCSSSSNIENSISDENVNSKRNDENIIVIKVSGPKKSRKKKSLNSKNKHTDKLLNNFNDASNSSTLYGCSEVNSQLITYQQLREFDDEVLADKDEIRLKHASNFSKENFNASFSDLPCSSSHVGNKKDLNFTDKTSNIIVKNNSCTATANYTPRPNLSFDIEENFIENDSFSSLPKRSASISSTPSPSDESLSESESFHYGPKGVDVPSVLRLAKRLYFLDGFKKNDVSPHLSKNNEFNKAVADEYLCFFDFVDKSLDVALRQFLSRFCLSGETQERERVLVHFSKRYLDCNPGALNSQDAVHTLTCAIMLLNTDLHNVNIGRKMTLEEFILNLSDLNDGQNFNRSILKSLYQSISNEPLKWNPECEVEPCANGSAVGDSTSVALGSNPFLSSPVGKGIVYKKGFIMRKCCFDAGGKRTPFGKRGWKMWFCVIQDLLIFLYKEEQKVRRVALTQLGQNAIRLHHAFAERAKDYSKKEHVFRLRIVDQSECLIQTSDSRELWSWVEAINFVAASLSAAPLPGAVGSQEKFQRPLLPSGITKLGLMDQLEDHVRRVNEISEELNQMMVVRQAERTTASCSNNFREKESFLNFELKRYQCYIDCLRARINKSHLISQKSLVKEMRVFPVDPVIEVLTPDGSEESRLPSAGIIPSSDRPIDNFPEIESHEKLRDHEFISLKNSQKKSIILDPKKSRETFYKNTNTHDLSSRDFSKENTLKSAQNVKKGKASLIKDTRIERGTKFDDAARNKSSNKRVESNEEELVGKFDTLSNLFQSNQLKSVMEKSLKASFICPGDSFRFDREFNFKEPWTDIASFPEDNFNEEKKVIIEASENLELPNKIFDANEVLKKCSETNPIFKQISLDLEPPPLPPKPKLNSLVRKNLGTRVINA